MINKGLYSSEKDDWTTPEDMIENLSCEFKWDLDVCASYPNVCERYNSIKNPARYSWHGLCWCNPPYGRSIGKWMKMARLNSQFCKAVVCLVPARTDTRWWHDNVSHAALVVFIKGRLRFGEAKTSAPFPSAFVVFGDGLSESQINKLAGYGIAYRTGEQ